MQARQAASVLHALIRAEQRLLARLPGGSPADGLRAVLARTQRVLASVSADALGTKLMSPAHTVVPATARAVAEARAAVRAACAA